MRSSVPVYILHAVQGRPVTSEMPSVNAAIQAGPHRARSLAGSGRRAPPASPGDALTSDGASGGPPCVVPSRSTAPPPGPPGEEESESDPDPESKREEESESESESEV